MRATKTPVFAKKKVHRVSLPLHDICHLNAVMMEPADTQAAAVGRHVRPDHPGLGQQPATETAAAAAGDGGHRRRTPAATSAGCSRRWPRTPRGQRPAVGRCSSGGRGWEGKGGQRHAAAAAGGPAGPAILATTVRQCVNNHKTGQLCGCTLGWEVAVLRTGRRCRQGVFFVICMCAS